MDPHHETAVIGAAKFILNVKVILMPARYRRSYEHCRVGLLNNAWPRNPDRINIHCVFPCIGNQIGIYFQLPPEDIAVVILPVIAYFQCPYTIQRTTAEPAKTLLGQVTAAVNFDNVT